MLATGPTLQRAAAVQRLFDELTRFGRTLKARGADWAQLDPGLSRGDVHALGVLELRGPLRPGLLALELGVDPSVVSRQLVALQGLGLVERHADPADGRAELVSLTPTGRDRLGRVRAGICDALAARLATWDAADLDSVCALVSDLTQRLQTPLTTLEKDLHA